MADTTFNFTEAALNALPAAAKGQRAVYHDTKVPGLDLRVTDTGKKTYCVFRRVRGTVTRHTIGDCPTIPLPKARVLAQEALTAMALGFNPNDAKKAQRGDRTLAELFADFLENHVKPHKKSARMDESQYRLYLSRWGARKLSTIQRADVRDLHKRIGEANGIYAANRTLAQLRKMYNYAMEHGYDLAENPAKGVQAFKEKARARRLNAPELPAFFQALAEETNETLRDYVLISLLTGQRKANVLAMRWNEIVLDRVQPERSTWHIPETKNGTAHSVPLTVRAIEVLERRRAANEGSPSVFPGTGNSGHLEDPKRGWARLLERAGLNDLRIHDLRRTLASFQIDTGATMATVGATLNHQNPSTTAIYARMAQDPIRASLEMAHEAIYKRAELTAD